MAEWDTHKECRVCTAKARGVKCSRVNTCETCCGWPEQLWKAVDRLESKAVQKKKDRAVKAAERQHRTAVPDASGPSPVSARALPIRTESTVSVQRTDSSTRSLQLTRGDAASVFTGPQQALVPNTGPQQALVPNTGPEPAVDVDRLTAVLQHLMPQILQSLLPSLPVASADAGRIVETVVQPIASTRAEPVASISTEPVIPDIQWVSQAGTHSSRQSSRVHSTPTRSRSPSAGRSRSRKKKKKRSHHRSRSSSDRDTDSHHRERRQSAFPTSDPDRTGPQRSVVRSVVRESVRDEPSNTNIRATDLRFHLSRKRAAETLSRAEVERQTEHSRHRSYSPITFATIPIGSPDRRSGTLVPPKTLVLTRAGRPLSPATTVPTLQSWDNIIVPVPTRVGLPALVQPLPDVRALTPVVPEDTPAIPVLLLPLTSSVDREGPEVDSQSLCDEAQTNLSQFSDGPSLVESDTESVGTQRFLKTTSERYKRSEPTPVRESTQSLLDYLEHVAQRSLKRTEREQSPASDVDEGQKPSQKAFTQSVHLVVEHFRRNRLGSPQRLVPEKPAPMSSVVRPDEKLALPFSAYVADQIVEQTKDLTKISYSEQVTMTNLVSKEVAMPKSLRVPKAVWDVMPRITHPSFGQLCKEGRKDNGVFCKDPVLRNLVKDTRVVIQALSAADVQALAMTDIVHRLSACTDVQPGVRKILSYIQDLEAARALSLRCALEATIRHETNLTLLQRVAQLRTTTLSDRLKQRLYTSPVEPTSRELFDEDLFLEVAQDSRDELSKKTNEALCRQATKFAPTGGRQNYRGGGGGGGGTWRGRPNRGRGFTRGRGGGRPWRGGRGRGRGRGRGKPFTTDNSKE